MNGMWHDWHRNWFLSRIAARYQLGMISSSVPWTAVPVRIEAGRALDMICEGLASPRLGNLGERGQDIFIFQSGLRWRTTTMMMMRSDDAHLR